MAPLFIHQLELSNEVAFHSIIYPFYTFGQPRVGNKAYSEWAMDVNKISSLHFRVVHHDDPVPHLPPPVLGFFHTNTEIWYAENGYGLGTYEICDSSTGEDMQCSAGTALSADFTDHLTYLGHEICGCVPSGFDQPMIDNSDGSASAGSGDDGRVFKVFHSLLKMVLVDSFFKIVQYVI